MTTKEQFAQTILEILNGPIIDGQKFKCEALRLHEGNIIEATLVCNWEQKDDQK